MTGDMKTNTDTRKLSGYQVVTLVASELGMSYGQLQETLAHEAELAKVFDRLWSVGANERIIAEALRMTVADGAAQW